MMNPIKTGSGVGDRSPDRRSPGKDREAAQPAPSAPAAEEAAPGEDLRLVIEPDPRGVDYVYKLIDRTTGEVVAERSRAEVASLAEGPDYRAGSVVSTKA